MTYYVNVTPTPENRRALAVALVTADPLTRMAGHGVFSVHRDVFLDLSEQLLVGALVDGTLYRPVKDERPATGGTVTSTVTALVGETGPETVKPDLICADCDKVAASAAGLAAHRRAKHEGE